MRAVRATRWRPVLARRPDVCLCVYARTARCTRGRLGVRARDSVYARTVRCTRGRLVVRRCMRGRLGVRADVRGRVLTFGGGRGICEGRRGGFVGVCSLFEGVQRLYRGCCPHSVGFGVGVFGVSTRADARWRCSGPRRAPDRLAGDSLFRATTGTPWVGWKARRTLCLCAICAACVSGLRPAFCGT